MTLPMASPKIIRALDHHRNQRLDLFLTSQFPERSRSQVQKWIEEEHVLINGRPVKSAYRIQGEEQIEIQIQPRKTPSALPEAIPLNIIHEDEDLIVVNKSAGMVVHLGAGVRQGTLVNALLHRFQQLSQCGNVDRPGIVHRLDKQTSGLLVVAKNDNSHLSLAQQFQSRSVRKEYVALVHGKIDQDGKIVAPIARDRFHRTKMTTRASGGRDALTTFVVKERFSNFTLLHLNIKTGRTHQIRVHLSSIRHPVVGDKTYGAPSRLVIPEVPNAITLGRNFLHASLLELDHPRTSTRMRFFCPLPEVLEELLDRLRKSNARRDAIAPS